MNRQIRTNGIYFRQYDVKETGYFTTDKDGQLVKHKYKSPSFLEKTKFFFKNRRLMNTDTIYTSFYLFNTHGNDVWFGNCVGDAVSMAKELKKSCTGFESLDYKCQNNKIILIYKENTVELNVSEDGRLITEFVKKKTAQESNISKKYVFLEWDYI